MNEDWTILGIAPHDDPVEIRRAYAARLKVTRVDDDPAAFIRLRGAYERLLATARGNRVDVSLLPSERHESPTDTAPVDDAAPPTHGAPREDVADVTMAVFWQSIDDTVLAVLALCQPFAPVDRAVSIIAERRDSETLDWFSRFETELALALRDGEPAEPASISQVAMAMGWNDAIHLERGSPVLRDPRFRLRIHDAIERTTQWRRPRYVEAPWYAWAMIVALLLGGFGVVAVVFRITTDTRENPGHNMYPLIGSIALLITLLQIPVRAAFNGDPLPYGRLGAILAAMVAVTLYGFGVFD